MRAGVGQSRTADWKSYTCGMWNVSVECGMWNLSWYILRIIRPTSDAFTDKVEGYICIDGVWEMQRVVTVNSGERPRQLGKSK